MTDDVTNSTTAKSSTGDSSTGNSSIAGSSITKRSITASSIISGSIAISRAAFDFVDEIERIADKQLMMARFERELRNYGFHAWLITGLPNAGGRIDPLMMLNGWPQGWSEVYTKANYVRDDPVVAHCLRSAAPFEWVEAPYDRVVNLKAKEVMDRATDFGMNDGYCVPIHSSDGYQAVVTMAGERVELPAPVRRALHLMALYAHGKAAELCSVKAPPLPRVLTKREREVLQWTAAGKTAWEISQILGVSESTITAHLKAAAVKFDTPNRVATVVAALRRGEISL
jgi:LuxR family quorum sensing-dependent transcriptional regulator